MLKPTISTGIDMPTDDQPSVTVKKNPQSPLNDPSERNPLYDTLLLCYLICEGRSMMPSGKNYSCLGLLEGGRKTELL